MAMDVKRDPAILKKKKIRRAILGGLAIIAIIAISVAVSKLKPAAPGVSATTLWFGTVKRGPLVREVHGAGTLVPEDIRWIPATTSGRVENIVLRPGAIVKPGTVILVMSNPDLQMQANNAELQWKSSVAALENAKSQLTRHAGDAAGRRHGRRVAAQGQRRRRSTPTSSCSSRAWSPT